MEPSRVPQLDRQTIRDERLLTVLDRADRLSTPKPAWYLVLGHSPEMAVGYAEFWELTHRGGLVDHVIKELMRVLIAQLLGCDFCAGQRSIPALEAGLDEEELLVCEMPDLNHPDPKTRAALRFARALVLDEPTADGSRFDDVYAELRSVYTDAEVVELGCFAAIAIGGVKLARSLRIEP